MPSIAIFCGEMTTWKSSMNNLNLFVWYITQSEFYYNWAEYRSSTTIMLNQHITHTFTTFLTSELITVLYISY